MASFEPRGNAYRAIVRVPGGGKKTATFDTEREARAWAHVMEGKVQGLGTSKGATNELLFETYLDAVAGKTDSAKWNKLRIAKFCLDPIAKDKVVETTTHHINLWIARALKNVSPATVRRELNLMSGAFAYAMKALQWIETNPCHGAARPEQSKPRKRALLSEDEIRALMISTGYDKDKHLHTLTARVGACFLLSLETGMRSGELLRARPQDYHRKAKYIHVAAIEAGGRKGARSGRGVDASRNVPLTHRAIELLDQLLKTMPKDQPYIVGMNDAQRDALWRKTRDRAGVKDLHFHDTKHEACTRLAKFIDVLDLSHAVGTKDIRLLRDTYYNVDATRTAALLPKQLSPTTETNQ